jgi:hypothetical protein
VAEAERLAARLATAPLELWRIAALGCARDPSAPAARAALVVALGEADRVRLWALEDELEPALFRWECHEGAGMLPRARERQDLRDATRIAVEALACRDRLTTEQLRTLVGPMQRLVDDVA